MPKKVFKPASPSSAADNEELPALHKAIEEGNRTKVKRLLAAKADVNAPDADGMKPLFYAVAEGNMEVIADLLAAKADVNAVVAIKGLSGLTPLHYSVLLDQPATIDILIGKKADINRRDNDGRTPLHFAALVERPAVARALIKHGANVNLGDNDKATPLHFAAQKDHWIVADILIDNRAKLNLADNHGDTPLHDAAWKGSFDVAKRLIDAEANIGKKNNMGRTPLYIAQDQEGHNKVADALIDAGNFGDMVAPSPEHKSIPERVYDRAWESIVAIYVDDEHAGSGVIVGDERVVTNRHVVEDSENISVRKAKNRIRISEKMHERPAERIDDSDSGTRDLCLLKVEGVECPPIKIRKYNTLVIGEDVYAIGNPEGWELSLSAGIVSQLREEGHRKIQTDAAISGGSSGGGLFDREGNLIGITTGVYEDNESHITAQNLNFAIPADWLFGILPNRAA